MIFKRISYKISNFLIYPLRLNWTMITDPDKYIFQDNRSSWFVFLRRAFFAIVRTEPCIPFEIKTKYLFIKSLQRPDYDDFFSSVIHQCKEDKQFIDILHKKADTDRFMKAIIKMVWFLPVLIKIINLDLTSSLYRYLKAISYISVLKIMRRYEFQHLIVFADMQGVENMLVQYFRARGKKTVTMQHGLYVDYSDYENINRINYMNVASEYFLAWGEETKQLIKRYHPTAKIAICGKPLFLKPVQQSGKKYFTLVFDQLLFTNQNMELLSISYKVASSLNMMVNVRIHPWDKIEKYVFINHLTCFGKDISASDFVIGHTTSMVFECQRIGIPAFKYRTLYPSNVINNNLTFSDAEVLIARLRNISNYNFIEAGKFYIRYIGNESLNKYGIFFNKLINN